MTVCLPTVQTDRAQLPDIPGVAMNNWELSTGSRVAVYYYVTRPGVPSRTVPIVYLHGGPIKNISRLEYAFLRNLANHDYDIYAYEQAGAGRSSLLAMSEYSIDRSRADAKAFLDRLSTPVDILSHLAGGIVLAHMLADPTSAGAIRKAVFVDPGPMDRPTAALAGSAGKPNAKGLVPPPAGTLGVPAPRYGCGV